ncbi:TPA: tryptophan synthase subunit beta, partial [Streptococcus suis]|nr:tryptophan synthase subunit beta [Streptococcus suis]
MNITYIVGNGLDLQYGLKTRYKDFYNYQKSKYDERKKKGYSNYIYESLFKDQVNDYENWSDFEISIGELTQKNLDITVTEDNKEKFIDDFADVVDDLRDYLREVQNSFDVEKYTIDFEGTLTNLRNNLPSIHQNIITQLTEQSGREHDYINLLTLNYTDVFDKLYNQSVTNFYNQLRNNQYYFYLKTPVH